jgi:SAM-dependent methyltransferase
VTVLPYGLLYRLGFAPWERRDVADSWRPLLDGPRALAPGRALDVGCGSGRDAIHLAKRGWQVTAVDSVEKALASARRRASEEGVEVQWVAADVAALGRLGLKPGYDLLYDFGCIHGLSDAARRGTAAGLTQLAAPGATLLITAFKAGRGIVLPRGMNQEDILALLGDAWELEETRSVLTEDAPAILRRARPTVYRLTRSTQVAQLGAHTDATTEDPSST